MALLTSGYSSEELAVAVVLTLFGVFAREFVVRAIDAFQARNSSLKGWFWEICYRSGDTEWKVPDSIELVKVGRRGRSVRGKMYQVYRRKGERDWAFSGELIDKRQLCLTHRSIGRAFASNGVMILGPLNDWLWCGGFHEAPDPERNAELGRMAMRVGAVRWIGANLPEESNVEWIAVGKDPDRRVRSFLATIPPDLPWAPVNVAERLPRRVRRILLASSPRFGKAQLIEPAPWLSPSREILFGGDDEDEVA